MKKILLSHQNIKHRAMLSLIYACGLRRGELLKLKLTGIDSKRGVLKVNLGKGAKDRVIPISEKVLELLREYYLYEKSKEYLFEGTSLCILLFRKKSGNVLNQAVKKTGLTKKPTLYWLPHSYTIHLLENGTDLCYIQQIRSSQQ